jgi:alkylation response protein AidB-like acyl-CoA dehydrogenase
MVLARTDPTAAKHAGITYFIIDMKAPGIEIRPIQQINRAKNFNEVFFSDVRIPDLNRIGGINDGWRGAITTLMNERSALGGGADGLGFPDLLDLATQTPSGLGRAIDDSDVRQQLANFYCRLRGLQYTSYRTLTSISRGTTPGPQRSMGKLVAARMRQEMTGFAMEMQGIGAGVMDINWNDAGGAWAQAYLASPGGRLAGGTDEILRNIIAERILGLPAEARADKGIPFKDIPTSPPGKS